MKHKILAVIPARGGSKGIPRKNLRFIHGKPLISYAIKNSINCKLITDCVVTTDDDEIESVAKSYGIYTVRRGKSLSDDFVTLDPVIFDAVEQIEKLKGISYDIVITLQPTSPLLTTNTLEAALSSFLNDIRLDTLISVVNKPHLSWTKRNGRIVPNYEKRLNRQQLPPSYVETGAFFITKREFIQKNTRLGTNISVFEVPENEATDIDSVEDWIVSESILDKKNIIFRVDGMKERGLGHIYNCITMAFDFIEHNVLFVTREDCIEGLRKIQSTNLPYKTIKNEAELEQIIKDFKPDIWVNDCLNTTEDYMKWLKARVNRIISIEDLGPGTQYADAVINALYEKQRTLCPNTYEGYKYVCLRNEFLIENPVTFREHVRSVVIMFGGTDPSNLNVKLYKIAKILTSEYTNLRFDFVTGLGYDCMSHGLKDDYTARIYIHNNVSKVTDFMKQADIMVTSQGRTVFEIASLAIPAVVLAQNERELTHTFATMKNGFINLGLGKKVDELSLYNTIKWLIDTPNIRRNMHELMLQNQLRTSKGRIKQIILGTQND